MEHYLLLNLQLFNINNYSLTAVFEEGCYPLGDTWGQPIPLKLLKSRSWSTLSNALA